MEYRTLSPLGRFGQGLSYSSQCLLSQSAGLQYRFVQGYERVKLKTCRPLDDHWVILMPSKAFNYFRARRNEIPYAFDLPFIVD